jgi:hypothetical protein
MPYVAGPAYDELLAENVVFLDLYDSSANCAIVECLARATPVVVNRLEAVVEYLGEDYPLYFDTLEEAAAKAEDDELVLDAHRSLLANPLRRQLGGAAFRRALLASPICAGLSPAQTRASASLGVTCAGGETLKWPRHHSSARGDHPPS